MSATRDRRKHELREKILQAAEGLFGENGYEGFSMRDLARAIGYSPTALYLHFKDKDALLAAVCRRSFAELEAAIARHRGACPDPTLALRAAMVGFIRFGRKFPGQYAAAFILRKGSKAAGDGLSPDAARHEAPAAPQRPGAKAFAGFRDMVAAHLAARGSARDPDEAAQCVWAAIHGMATLFVTHPNFPWKTPDTLPEVLTDILLAGLESPANPPSPLPGGTYEP